MNLDLKNIYCQTQVRPEDALWNHSCCKFPEPALVWFNISGPSKTEKAVSDRDFFTLSLIQNSAWRSSLSVDQNAMAQMLPEGT